MGSLTHTRCFNHGQREAVARCPSCRRHFCRECVTEHEHRLLCASCMASLSSAAQAPARKAWPIVPAAQFLAALFVLWMAFYMMGQALLLIPSEFHDMQPGFFEALDTIEPGEDSGSTTEEPEDGETAL